MRFIRRFTCVLCLLIAPSLTAEPPLGDWPQWMGPNRSNHSVETGLLKTWPDHGPPLIWKTEGLGHGVASVAVSGGRVFTLGYREEREFVTALDEMSGKLLWSVAIGPFVPEQSIMRFLAQRTPTIDQNRVYAVSARGVLVCLDTHNGQERWRKELIDDLRGARGNWGFCDYPLVDGEQLICTPAGSVATFVAFNKQSGQLLWKTAIPDAGANAYSAAVVAEFCGVRQYINVVQNGIISVSAADGRFLWRYNGLRAQAGNTHNLILLDDGLFYSNGFATGCARLRMEKKNATIQVNEVYRHKNDFQSWFGTAIRFGNQVLSLTNNGLPQAHALDNGEKKWTYPRRLGFGRAAMTFADGHAILRYSDGDVMLVEIASDKAILKGMFPGPKTENEMAWTMPVVTGGRLFIRDHDRIFCYDLKEPRRKTRAPDAVFVATPQDVVEKMLEMVQLKKTDRVYDLGCGDGRIVVTAARRYGTTAIGIELDPECVRLSLDNIKKHHVEHLVRVEQIDLFKADFSQADVIALYLLPNMNEKLIPAFANLKPGTRIVAHHFPIPGIVPDRVQEVESTESGEKHKIYLWTTPLKIPPR